MPPTTQASASSQHQQLNNTRPSDAQTLEPRFSSSAPRDTGFSEPLSKFSNTTLPHKDALTGPGEELDVGVIAEKKRHRHPTLPGRKGRRANTQDIEAEMYRDLEVVDAEGYEKTRREGKFKKALHKLPCTH